MGQITGTKDSDPVSMLGFMLIMLSSLSIIGLAFYYFFS